MRVSRAKQKLLAGEMVVGTHISIPSPMVAEVCGLLGFDFIIIDLEHGLFNPETFVDIVRAAENAGATPIFRPIKNDPELMLPYLDNGAMGVWVAGISSAEDARQVVQAVKYAPLGSRGMTAERISMYRLGPSAKEIIRHVNDNTIVSLGIEGQQGIDNLDEICAVEGVDVVGIGINDLAAALGHPGQVDHPSVQEAIARVVGKVRKAGKVAGIPSYDPATARKYYDLGVRYTWTIVNNLIARGGKSYLEGIKAFSEKA